MTTELPHQRITELAASVLSAAMVDAIDDWPLLSYVVDDEFPPADREGMSRWDTDTMFVQVQAEVHRQQHLAAAWLRELAALPRCDVLSLHSEPRRCIHPALPLHRHEYLEPPTSLGAARQAARTAKEHQ